MLEIKNITSKGEAISGLSLTVEQKGIFGVLSVDGRARTELSRALAGCEDVKTGEIVYDGKIMGRDSLELKKEIRLVPSRLELDSADTPAEYLDIVGYTMGVEPEKRYRQIKEALELMGLEDAQNRPFGGLDTSQRVRLSVAGSLMGNPRVIVIDDPFRRVGERQLDGIYDTLAMIGQRKTVILMSHTPAEVKRLCDSVAVICGGRVVLEGKVSEIEGKINSTREMHIKARGDWDRIRPAIEGVDRVVSVRLMSEEKNNVRVIRVEYVPDNKMRDRLFGALSEINVPMLSANEIVLTLDDVFYTLTAEDKKRIDSLCEDNAKKKSKKRGGKTQ